MCICIYIYVYMYGCRVACRRHHARAAASCRRRLAESALRYRPQIRLPGTLDSPFLIRCNIVGYHVLSFNIMYYRYMDPTNIVTCCRISPKTFGRTCPMPQPTNSSSRDAR